VTEIDLWTATAQDGFVSGMAEIRWPDGTKLILCGAGVRPAEREAQVRNLVRQRGITGGAELRVRRWRWPPGAPRV
jgi:hypothetical protein